MEKIQTLLSKVHEIILIARQRQEAERAKGEHFNVFDVLGLTNNETRLHSAFIAELLNPKGSHGLRDKFLDHFIDLVWPDMADEFSSETADVLIEKYIGVKNEDSSEGGRIDIIIKDENNNAVIIENKIYAGDQEKQLLRYYNYGCENHIGQFRLFYLTLYGDEATGYSTGDTVKVDEQYYTISYMDTILTWLSGCVKIAYAHPLVRETVIQYMNLIKQITHQNMDSQNVDSIIKLMKDNAEDVKAIYGVKDKYEKAVVEEYIVKYLKGWADDNGLEFKTSDNFFQRKKHCSIEFKKKDYIICIRAENSDWKGFYVGLKCDARLEKQSNLRCFTGPQESDLPYGWEWLKDKENDYSNWDYSIMPDIIDGRVGRLIVRWVEAVLKEMDDMNFIL